MANASIVGVWAAGGRTYVAAVVPGDAGLPSGGSAPVEYIASVDSADLIGLTAAQQKVLLGQALRTERAARLALLVPTPTVVPGITGTVTV